MAFYDFDGSENVKLWTVIYVRWVIQ